MSKEQEQSNKDAYEHDYPDALNDVQANSEWDVVVIGAGPAGLMLATSLARFGGHKVLVADIRTEPTTAGRADGIQPRTIEVLKNMQPLGDILLSRSSASYERTFWDPTADGKGIERSRRAQSFPDELEIEDGCTLGLQQGLIEQAFLRDMDDHGLRVTRPWGFKSFELSETGAYPVSVTLQREPSSEGATDGGELKTVRTKYLVGCDGGRSAVRLFMEENHGVFMTGDYVDTLWGAIDAVVKSDFPDLRKIAAIHSQNYGAMYIFPRENNKQGKPIVRLYTQVNKATGSKSAEPATTARWKVKAEDIMEADKKIIAPYKLEFEQVEWWTAYPIGQRLVNQYSLNNRVFIAGDACHTHSPKAGQGMNTALMDSHNLSFKLNLVLRGLAPESLLQTYHDERWKVGKRLIDFDEEYSALFSGEVPKSAPHVANMSPAERKAHFANVQRRNAAFTTGAGVNYEMGSLIVPNDNLSRIGLQPIEGLKLRAGERLLPASVTRCVNTAPVRLIHEIQYDLPGGFRIYVLAGRLAQNKPKLAQLSKYLTSPRSFVQRFNAPLPDVKRPLPEVLNTGLMGYEELNPWFSILTVVRESRFGFEIEDLRDLPGLNAMIYADDEDPSGDRIGNGPDERHVGGTHRKYGLEDGGIVVVRPDGYVGVAVPLEEAGWKALETYFDGFLQERRKSHL